MSLKSVTAALGHVLDAFENSQSINTDQRASLEAARTALAEAPLRDDLAEEVNTAAARAAESATAAQAALQSVRDEKAEILRMQMEEGLHPVPVVAPAAAPVIDDPELHGE